MSLVFKPATLLKRVTSFLQNTFGRLVVLSITEEGKLAEKVKEFTVLCDRSFEGYNEKCYEEH